MSKVSKLSFFVIALTFFSCIKYNSLNVKSLIIETQFSGDRVVFADLSKDLFNQDIINKNWSRINSKKRMPYFRLKNNSGEIKGDFIHNAERYLIVQTNNGNLFKWKYNSMLSRSLPSHLATLSAIEEAKLFIGKNIWLNEIYSDSIFINNSEKIFKRFDKVIVLGIRIFQNSKTDMPIWLELDTNNEHNAYIRYNGKFKTELRQNNYYKENPLKKEWSKTIIENLKKKKIEYGMSFEQVRVSVGNPEIINNTSSANGVSQQWVYGKNLDEKKYLLFKNGKLVSM